MYRRVVRLDGRRSCDGYYLQEVAVTARPRASRKTTASDHAASQVRYENVRPFALTIAVVGVHCVNGIAPFRIFEGSLTCSPATSFVDLTIRNVYKSQTEVTDLNNLPAVEDSYVSCHSWQGDQR